MLDVTKKMKAKKRKIWQLFTASQPLWFLSYTRIRTFLAFIVKTASQRERHTRKERKDNMSLCKKLKSCQGQSAIHNKLALFSLFRALSTFNKRKVQYVNQFSFFCLSFTIKLLILMDNYCKYLHIPWLNTFSFPDVWLFLWLLCFFLSNWLKFRFTFNSASYLSLHRSGFRCRVNLKLNETINIKESEYHYRFRYNERQRPKPTFSQAFYHSHAQKKSSVAAFFPRFRLLSGVSISTFDFSRSWKILTTIN